MAERSRPGCRLVFPAVLALLPLLALAQPDGRPTVTFGSLLDPSERGATERLLGLIESETRELLQRDYDVRFPPDKALVSDWTRDGIRQRLLHLLHDPEVDIVLVVGPVSTAMLCCIPELPKPVFAPLAVDPEALGLPMSADSSGVRNLNYLSSPGSSYRDLEMFREIVGFDVVHIASDPLIYEVLEGLYERNEAALRPLGISTQPVSVTSSAEEFLAALPSNTQAVYVTPLLRMSIPELRKAIDGLNARGIPSMSLLGRDEVELGMLAGMRAPAEYPRVARRIALNVQQALFGQDPGGFSISLERTDRLVINMGTARRIGLYPTWRVLADAELINEEIPTANKLDLSQAVLAALEANRQVLAAEHEVSAGAQAVREVQSGYRPQLNFDSTAVQIDEDRAGAFQAERQFSARVRLNQVVWSDPLRTAIRIERDLQQSRQEGLTGTELDVAADAASAFLDVLRAETLERIERENLRRVQTNLELARNRQRVGYANPAEVYRWEIERANGRNAVVAAGRLVDALKSRMNQLMYRRQEEPFVTEEPDVEGDPYLAVANEELTPFYDNPWSFRVFRNFMVESGLSNSPELAGLDAAIQARRRAWRLSRRAFWMPTVAFEGSYDRIAFEGGIGSETEPLFPTRVPNQWRVGLLLSLPLYLGGERTATLHRNREELLGLISERENLSDLIELRIRTAMFSVSASWTNIDLSREAALAARKTFELVTDSYAKGVISIQDLLDAQNASLTAELNAANAVYNFLLDLVEVQRASGRLEWFRAEEDRDAWIQEIRDYFDEVRRSGEQPGGFE